PPSAWCPSGSKAVEPERRQVERRPTVEKPFAEELPDDRSDRKAVAAEPRCDVNARDLVDDRYLVRGKPFQADPAPGRLGARKHWHDFNSVYGAESDVLLRRATRPRREVAPAALAAADQHRTASHLLHAELPAEAEQHAPQDGRQRNRGRHLWNEERDRDV